MSTPDERLDDLERRLTIAEEQIDGILTDQMPYIKARLTRLENEERKKILENVQAMREEMGKLRQVLQEGLAPAGGLVGRTPSEGST